MQILVLIGTVGASPQIGEILPPCDFFDCPVLSLPFSRSYAQVEPLDQFSRFMAQTTCFHAGMVLLGVRTMGDHIWGKYAPKNGREWAIFSQNGKI